MTRVLVAGTVLGLANGVLALLVTHLLLRPAVLAAAGGALPAAAARRGWVPGEGA